MSGKSAEDQPRTKTTSREGNSRRQTDISRLPATGEPDDSVSVAAIYARTSASKKEYHYSIDEQVTACWDRCRQQGWEVGWVFADEAESGTNIDRPEFQEMLTKAENGLFDVTVFWALDRFCRSLSDLVKTEEKLNDWGVALQSCTEYIDTASPVGRFNFRNLASAAELESDLTSQRVQMGFLGMAREHRWPNETPPLGYILDDDRRLSIIESEAELVRQVFHLYLDERSMPTVALRLNEAGSTTKSGKEWDRWAVRRVLSNEIYRGLYSVADYEERVEEYRIVSDDLFEEVTDTRFRFQNSGNEMDSDRKATKAEQVFAEFRQAKE